VIANDIPTEVAKVTTDMVEPTVEPEFEAVENVPNTLSPERRIEISELTKLVRTKIARGELTDARAKIIEGLAIDKWNKELNCLLASLYERDNEYRKAEFIYKDLILVHDTDAEIYMKLGFSLSIQGKYEIAYEIYKKLLEISDSHIEAAEMLANIAHELGRHEQAIEYSRLFLKSYPRNADMLTVLSVSLIDRGQKEEALESLSKLKNLDPYNPRVREMKEKLELELELGKKFATEDQKANETPTE
jgi:tetratricopeptide (TPR) repeat protein